MAAVTELHITLFKIIIGQKHSGSRDQVQKAILSLKDGKTPGPDGTYMWLLKLINNNIYKLTSIFHRIYNVGHNSKE